MNSNNNSGLQPKQNQQPVATFVKKPPVPTVARPLNMPAKQPFGMSLQQNQRPGSAGVGNVHNPLRSQLNQTNGNFTNKLP